MRVRLCTLASLALLAAGPATAAEPDARAAFVAGDWSAARTLGANAAEAGQRLAAAEAALAPLVLGQRAESSRSDRRAAAQEAAELARAVLALAPEDPAARRCLAIALGYEARYTSPLRAALDRLPQRGLAEIERAVALDPGAPDSLALLGAWNIEIVRRAGEGAFGARLQTGLDSFRAAADAAAATGSGPAIPYQFALQLLALDADAYRDEAVIRLRQAAAAPVRTALDAGLAAQAQTLLPLAETSPQTAQDEARRRMEA